MENNEEKEEIIELVDLEQHAKEQGTVAPKAKEYAFRVDRDRVVVKKAKITGKEILAEVNKTP